MKKLLIASTALVATAGVAAADITIGGGARFGLQYNNWADMSPAAGLQAWGIEKRMTLNIDGKGETDGGMTFGGRVRLRSDEYIGTAASGANVYIGMGGFKLTAGNINGALEMMPGLYNNAVGLTGLGFHGVVLNNNGGGGAPLLGSGYVGTNYWGWDAFSSRGNGSEGVALDYSGGSFSAHLSHGTTTGFTAASGSATFGDFTVALGVQRDSVAGVSKDDVVVGIVSGSFGDFGVNFGYAARGATFGDKWVIGGDYSMGDFGVNAFFSREADALWVSPVNTWGIGATYDLGGATIAAGYSAVRCPTCGIGGWTINQADFGIRVNF